MKLYVRAGGTTVLTEVVDHAPPARGAAFDVSPALARLLGLGGRTPLEWRFTG